MDFRTPIRDRLLAQVTLLTDVLDTGVGRPGDIQFPYAVLHEQTEIPREGPEQYQSVWVVAPYVRDIHMGPLDQLVNEITVALDNVALQDADSNGFRMRHIDTGGQIKDEDWDGLTQPIRFGIEAWTPQQVQGEGTPSRSVDALVPWTQGSFPDLDVYGGIWPTAYAMPSVLWRQRTVNRGPLNAMMMQVSETVRGHPIATTKRERDGIARDIAMTLSETLKIPQTDGNHYVSIDDVGINTAQNPFRQGLIEVSASYVTAHDDERPADVQNVETEVNTMNE